MAVTLFGLDKGLLDYHPQAFRKLTGSLRVKGEGEGCGSTCDEGGDP